MSKTIKLLNLLFFTFMLASCASYDTARETPEHFVNRFYTYIQNNQGDEILNVLSSNCLKFDNKPCDPQELIVSQEKFKVLIAETSKEIIATGGIDHIEIKNQHISADGNNAAIDAIIHYKNGTTRNASGMNLIWTNAGWKLLN